MPLLKDKPRRGNKYMKATLGGTENLCMRMDAKLLER